MPGSTTPEDFARRARRYCALIERPGAVAAPFRFNIRIALAQCYAGALTLPSPSTYEFEHFPSSCMIQRSEWTERMSTIARLLGDHRYYQVIPEPWRQDREYARVDLTANLFEVYIHLRPSLTAYEQDHARWLERALHCWGDAPFRSHWGPHALVAMRALHHLDEATQ